MSREVHCARYCNTNGFAAAIVAVVNRDDDGSVFDWAVYFGATDKTWDRQDAVDAAADHGDKLSFEDAFYFFPDLPIERYRR